MRLGPYALRRLIGRGGTAEVWQALGPGGRPAAIKIITTQRPDNDEIAAIAALDHPHLVQVLDAGQVGEGTRWPQSATWYAMEQLASALLSHGSAPSWPALRGVLLDVLSGLGHAHARGWVHRDLKPGNILLDHQAELARRARAIAVDQDQR